MEMDTLTRKELLECLDDIRQRLAGSAKQNGSQNKSTLVVEVVDDAQDLREQQIDELEQMVLSENDRWTVFRKFRKLDAESRNWG